MIKLLKKVFHTERFEPSLIDLGKYEQSLRYSKQFGKRPVPVRPIPNIGITWTDKEMEAMKENRAQAQKLKDRIFGAIDD